MWGWGGGVWGVGDFGEERAVRVRGEVEGVRSRE